MLKKAMLMMACIAMGVTAMIPMLGAAAPVRTSSAKVAVAPIKVGVYDSRCIAVAYAASDYHESAMAELKKRHDAALAANDAAVGKAIEAEGQAMQDRMHEQAFGAAPVDEYLEPVKAELPKIAEKMGVDIIVSKWAIDYQNNDACFVDVTDAMVALYDPDMKTLKSVQAARNHPPMPREKVQTHGRHH